MTEPDTTALRALADTNWAAAWISTSDLRALCDGYDEAQRLRAQVARVGSCAQCGGWWLDRACGPTHAAVQAVAEHPVEVYAERDAARDEAQRLRPLYEGRKADWKVALGERDAARQALTDLIGELRGLCDGPLVEGLTIGASGVDVDTLRAVIDRYDPEVP